MAQHVKTRQRVPVLDALRGAAVLLMILDHVLSVTDPVSDLRYTLTRLSLPLFCGVAAAIPDRSWSRRTKVLLAVAVVVEAALNPIIGLGEPGPVLLIVGALLVVTWGRKRDAVMIVGALGLLQSLYQPLGWTGYEPGLVVAWCALGGQAVRELCRSGRVPRVPALERVGRHAVAWYVGHLVVLGVAVG